MCCESCDGRLQENRDLNAVEVKDLTKNYRIYRRPFDRLKEAVLRKPRHDLVKALQNVTFHVPLGGTLGIIGENGAGKSTLLKILAGTVSPTSGSAFKQGRTAALLELGSGFHPEFSGRRNIYLNAALMGLTEKEIREREEPIIEFSELKDAIERPVKTYSSGMYVRLAFSIATSVDPDVLIIDEALSVGDQRFQQKCVERMMGFKAGEKTIIICSHSMYLINELCEYAIWLKNGRVCGSGSSASVISEYMAAIEEPKEPKESSARLQEPDGAATGGAVEILIEDVRLLNGRGKALEKPRQFNEMVVQVRTRRKGLPLKGHLSVGIYFRNGKRIFESTTKLADQKYIVFKGTQLTELVIPELTLSGGKYVVKARVGDEHALRVIDEFDTSPFVVESRNPEMGNFWLRHFWKVPNNDVVF